MACITTGSKFHLNLVRIKAYVQCCMCVTMIRRFGHPPRSEEKRKEQVEREKKMISAVTHVAAKIKFRSADLTVGHFYSSDTV